MCNGLEERLIDCPNRGIEVSSCSHSQDAGVICLAAPGIVDGRGRGSGEKGGKGVSEVGRDFVLTLFPYFQYSAVKGRSD